MTFKNIREKGNYRTEDADRQIVLRKIDGPTPEGFYTFEIDMEGELIRFSGLLKQAMHSHIRKLELKYDISWGIDRLSVPKAYKDRKKEICEIITEALKAWGDHYNEEIAHSVLVTFSPKLLV